MSQRRDPRVATLGLLLVIFGVVRSGRASVAAFSVGGHVAGAYSFTSSTSFANPAVTIGRMFSDTFAGIEPSGATVQTEAMELPLPEPYRAGLQREWDRLASAGTWWSGGQRVELAAVARAARAGDAAPVTELPTPAVEAAVRLSADPHVDLAWVEDLEQRGLDRPAYVEILGVLYMSIEQMGDLEIELDLNRAQIEFVAARTSLLNDCFF